MSNSDRAYTAAFMLSCMLWGGALVIMVLLIVDLL